MFPSPPSFSTIPPNTTRLISSLLSCSSRILLKTAATVLAGIFPGVILICSVEWVGIRVVTSRVLGSASQSTRKWARVSSRPLSHTRHVRLSIFHQSLSLWVPENTSSRILSSAVTKAVGKVIVQSCRQTHRVVLPGERVSYQTSAWGQFFCLRSCARMPFATRCLAAAAARVQIAFGPLEQSEMVFHCLFHLRVQ